MSDCSKVKDCPKLKPILDQDWASDDRMCVKAVNEKCGNCKENDSQ
jgi:hypothetical protein